MAERRMFAKTIIDSDAFLDMPLSAQALYFHLSMRADDDGFINNPKKIQRMIGASDDDCKLLIAKRFIITFESGVIVIKHWKIHNYIQKDRYKPTIYQEEKALLNTKDNKAYTECIQDGYNTDTQVRVRLELGKDSIELDKGNKGKKKPKEDNHTLFNRLIADYSISDVLIPKISEWLTYKTQRNETYVEQGLKSLLKQIENKAFEYGEQAIIDLIDESMGSNWKGIIFDRLKAKTEAAPKQTVEKTSEYNDFMAKLASLRTDN